MKEILIISRNEKENDYCFRRTVNLFNQGIRVYKDKKIIEFYNCKLRFITERYFDLYGNGLRAEKTFFGRWFEERLDEYEAVQKLNEGRRKSKSVIIDELKGR